MQTIASRSVFGNLSHNDRTPILFFLRHQKCIFAYRADQLQPLNIPIMLPSTDLALNDTIHPEHHVNHSLNRFKQIDPVSY